MLWKRPFLFPFLLFICLAGWAVSTAAQETTTPAPDTVQPTPTIDRLAPPPTVTSPTQADDGAYFYWLNCQPCHGDRGQGLTDDWRAQYPEEDQNCWNSGCHGKRPYEDGFTLPTTVPPVTGQDSLRQFQTLGQLYAYIRVAMPYEYPGALPDEEYLAITAFLAREHEVWDGTPLTVENVGNWRLQPLPPPTATPGPVSQTGPQDLSFNLFIAGLVGLFSFVGAFWIWKRKAI